VLGSAIRAFLAVLLVGIMATTAVAFAVGVNFSPRKTVCVNTGIPGYGPICTNQPSYNLKHIHVKGFGQIRACQKHVDLTFQNRNKVASHVKLVLTIKTRSGKTVRITKSFTLGVGKKITVSNPLKGSKIASAKLRLTVTDANGDVAVITSSTLGKPVACVKAVSVSRPPAFTASS
jgi:hypothetical protein